MRENRRGSVGARLVGLLIGLMILTSCATVDPSIVPLPLPATTGSITGVVLDGNTPVQGAAVSTLPPTASGATDANGRFTLSGVNPQTVTLVTEPAGFLAASKVVTVLPGVTLNATLNVVQATSGTINGRVTDGFNAVPDARVTITPLVATNNVTTALDGSFLFTNLTPGRYRLDVSKPGFFDTASFVTVTSGEIVRANIAATRRFDGSILGVVTDGVTPTGSTSTPVKITLFQPDGTRQILLRPEFVFAPPPGPAFPLPLNFNYVFSGLPGGTAIVQAELPGFPPGIKEVRIEPPRVANGEIILSADGTTGAIAGTVFDFLGRTLPNVTVTVGMPSQPITATTTTDQVGRYRAFSLPPGQYEIIATSPVAGTGTLQVNVGAAGTADGSLTVNP
jgi:large repetitive protein